MTAKSYEKTCARLVQEAEGIPYTTALRRVQDHERAYPAAMPVRLRALRIVDGEKP